MDLFEERNILEPFAIVCFFFTIDLNSRSFVEMLLSVFGIDRFTFYESMSDLEKRELVEIQHNVARVSEQVMATYIFYKVFIQDKLLSFVDLLTNYFPYSPSKFADSIIPANNAFGYDNVFRQIDSHLNQYYYPFETMKNYCSNTSTSFGFTGKRKYWNISIQSFRIYRIR